VIVITQSATTTTQPAELTYWKTVVAREVYTDDGKLLGALDGIMVDSKTWTVSHCVISVNKEIAEDLNFKKSMFGAELVNIPISFVKNVGDVVQLNANLASLKGAVSEHNAKKT
jgi:sporulation protein YlmC with PRC-barrel domain